MADPYCHLYRSTQPWLTTFARKEVQQWHVHDSLDSTGTGGGSAKQYQWVWMRMRNEALLSLIAVLILWGDTVASQRLWGGKRLEHSLVQTVVFLLFSRQASTNSLWHNMDKAVTRSLAKSSAVSGLRGHPEFRPSAISTSPLIPLQELWQLLPSNTTQAG